MQTYQQEAVKSIGDICSYWNKLVIVHRVDNDEGWAEVLKISNPENPTKVSGEPFSVRTRHLTLVQSSEASKGL